MRAGEGAPDEILRVLDFSAKLDNVDNVGDLLRLDILCIYRHNITASLPVSKATFCS